LTSALSSFFGSALTGLAYLALGFLASLVGFAFSIVNSLKNANMVTKRTQGIRRPGL
jgi:hypothetical protein